MTIQRIESGTRGGVRMEAVMLIAEALNVPFANMIFEAEQDSELSEKKESRWAYLSERIEKINPKVREAICDFLEKMLDKNWY